MGVNTRRPVLPAPTESIVDTTGDSTTGTDLATDLSRRTDKTSYSIPDDGSPVTFTTRRLRDRDDSKLPRSHRDSQTSLLIEYFEGGKGSGAVVSRPSVRVRVTPSAARKSKDKGEHIQITESGGSRKPSYTRRISLNSPSSKQKQLPESGATDDQSVSSANSAGEEGQYSSRRPPVEIEFVNSDRGSELSTASRDNRYIPATSDISSMPPDSIVEGASAAGPRRKRSQSLERGSNGEDKGLLKTPTRQRSRSLSTERIAHRVAEKLSGSPQEVTSGKHKSKSASKDYLEAEPKSSRRRRRGYGEDDVPSPESSLLSASAVSSNRKSDQYSIRSGASKSSINNPKLLETVEDAIRRLILPELKELKKDQKVMSNKSKFERGMTTSYSSTTSSRDELGRRLSKHASAPDVTKPKVVLNRDSKDEGVVLAGETAPRAKERKSSKSSEASDTAWVKWAARPDLSEQDKLRRQMSKGLRDAQAAGRVGNALTSAALNHHDSKSSLDKNDRRRRKSGSRKSTESVDDTELAFKKHNVAPLPMHSEIDSELTRDSLLSQRTETPTPRKKSQVKEISRGSPRQSPRQLGSLSPRTPTRTSLDSRNKLGMRHDNRSQPNLSAHSGSDHDLRGKSLSPGTDTGDWAIAAAAAANLLDAAQPEHRMDESEYIDERTGRTLSPIQSVASDQVETYAGRQSKEHMEGERDVEPRLSIGSLSSAPSTTLARSTRKDGMSPRSQTGPELGYGQSRGTPGDEDVYGSRSIDDEDSEVHYLDKIKEGQHVAAGAAANPQFVHPVDVESAVASLMDPSVLESQSSQSANRSQVDYAERAGSRSPEKPSSEGYRGSPLKQRQDASSPDETSFPRRMGVTSPPQSVTQSIEDADEAALLGGAPRGMESPLPGAEHSQESESEINTNPSIIQGPIGSTVQDKKDQWAYDSRSPPADRVPYYDTAGAKGLSAEQQQKFDAEYYRTARDIFGGDDYYYREAMDHHAAEQMFGASPGAKDEGYVSAANPMSPSIGTPKQGTRGLGNMETAGMGAVDSPASPDDTFVPGHQKHLSGYSHGVGSPLYDSATGRGIERIQSQDIVALMDHLTVRDAQRNARDTEILVTLVRSAAEMRNSFEEMKKFIAQQDDLIMGSSDKQHERTHKALGGPRPLPASGSRTRQLNTEDGEDMQSKRTNIFKRALKGLSLKSGNDLTKIEGMLEQLLEEVEALRAEQGMVTPRNGTGMTSTDPAGFEPSPTDSLSAYSINELRRNSDQRVSTVPEADEEDIQLDEGDGYMAEHLPVQEPARHERAGSLPLASPPQKPVATGARSTDTTPKASDKARKHKSSSSSIFPKISRWSKTTASSMGDNIRNSFQPGRKERPYSEESRSGSELAPDEYKTGNYYDPQGDDHIRSTYTLDKSPPQENRPPSPLVPSQVSEPPKYRAHRGSLDLQHPQPRQGPTGRYQTQLESQAQTYGPVSPNSDQWESNPSLSAVNPNTNRFSGGSRLSPISDVGYSDVSSRTERQPGPPRPPKIMDEGPLVPERPPKVTEDGAGAYGGDRMTSRTSTMRPVSQHTTPTRKPTGPRPLTSGGPYSPSNIKRNQYRGSPMQIDYDDDY